MERSVPRRRHWIKRPRKVRPTRADEAALSGAKDRGRRFVLCSSTLFEGTRSVKAVAANAPLRLSRANGAITPDHFPTQHPLPAIMGEDAYVLPFLDARP